MGLLHPKSSEQSLPPHCPPEPCGLPAAGHQGLASHVQSKALWVSGMPLCMTSEMEGQLLSLDSILNLDPRCLSYQCQASGGPGPHQAVWTGPVCKAWPLFLGFPWPAKCPLIVSGREW